MESMEVKVGGRLALACGGCGELILFLGRERHWYDPGDDGRPRSFPCGGCGQQLTLADRVVGAGDRAFDGRYTDARGMTARLIRVLKNTMR